VAAQEIKPVPPKREDLSDSQDLTAHPQLVEQYGQLPCPGNDGPFLSILSSLLGELQSPATQVAVLPKWPENVVRAC